MTPEPVPIMAGSKLGAGSHERQRAEDLYLRSEDDHWLAGRTKLVTPEFTQAIGEHWTRKSMRANTVVGVASA